MKVGNGGRPLAGPSDTTISSSPTFRLSQPFGRPRQTRKVGDDYQPTVRDRWLVREATLASRPWTFSLFSLSFRPREGKERKKTDGRRKRGQNVHGTKGRLQPLGSVVARKTTTFPSLWWWAGREERGPRLGRQKKFSAPHEPTQR